MRRWFFLRSHQVRTAEGGTTHVCPAEVCLLEMSIAQIGAPEIGIAQVCFSQVRSLEIGLSKISPVEINSAKIGPMKISPVEVWLDSLDISICSSPVIPKCFS